MKYRETQMTVWSYNHNCQLFNSDLLSVINHPVPTFDLTFNQLCPITHLSPKTKTFLMVLLSSPAVITTRTAFCNMTLSGHPAGEGGLIGLARVSLPKHDFLLLHLSTHGCIPKASFKRSNKTRGVKKINNAINDKKRWISEIISHKLKPHVIL